MNCLLGLDELTYSHSMASAVGGYSSSSDTTNSPGSCDACRRNCRPGSKVSPESSASDFTSAVCRRAVSTETCTPSAPAPPTPMTSLLTPGCEAKYCHAV